MGTRTALLFTGGIVHPFESSSPVLEDILRSAGFEVQSGDELAPVLEGLRRDPTALLVIYALRFSMVQHEKYAPLRERWSLTLDEAQRARIAGHVAGGGGLLGVHTASICFDGWPEWRDILGGAWEWGRSFHPLPGEVHVTTSRDHWLTRGIADFSLEDEVYSDLDRLDGLEVAAFARATDERPRPTGRQPVLWSHTYGRGRVVYDALGHDASSLGHPSHRRLLTRAALWAARCPSELVEAA